MKKLSVLALSLFMFASFSAVAAGAPEAKPAATNSADKKMAAEKGKKKGATDTASTKKEDGATTAPKTSKSATKY